MHHGRDTKRWKIIYFSVFADSIIIEYRGHGEDAAKRSVTKSSEVPRSDEGEIVQRCVSIHCSYNVRLLLSSPRVTQTGGALTLLSHIKNFERHDMWPATFVAIDYSYSHARYSSGK